MKLCFFVWSYQSFTYRREVNIRRWASLMHRGCFVYRGCRWMLSAWTGIESSMLQSPPSLPTVIFANPTTCLMSFPNVASRLRQTAPLLSWLSVWLKLPCLSGNRTLIYNTTPKLMFCGFHLCSVHSSSIALQQQCVFFWMDSSHLRSLMLQNMPLLQCSQSGLLLNLWPAHEVSGHMWNQKTISWSNS